ncbi:MAG: hypothetical protein LBU87_01550 [Lactobacillales bacterium]|jgi:acetoin utilization deacetylase AcuC-like enzyme|nr:hypothetical protein [Lactobacillales bacterium]
MKTTVYYDNDCLLHENSKDHPERRERLAEVVKALHKINDSHLFFVDRVAEAENDILRLVYSQEYIDFLKKSEPVKEGEYFILDKGRYPEEKDENYGASALCKGTMKSCLKGIGAVCKAVDDMKNKVTDNAFCGIRPPGHHADLKGAYGFCFFPNAVIGALYALKNGFKKIAILDHDVHHGNGTEDFLKGNKQVLFASIYEDEMWPYQMAKEKTVHESYDNIIKVVPKRNAPREEVMRAFDEEIVKPFEKFEPDLILISAGFDTHKNERDVPFSIHNNPVGMQNLHDEDYAHMIRSLKKITPNVICMMEGGYNISSLVSGVVAEVKALLEQK